MLEGFAYFTAPAICFLAACAMFFCKKDLGECFLTGAKEGMETSFSLIPAMVMLICGVRMLCASGILDVLAYSTGDFLSFLGIPREMLPLIIVRPFSGSASTAVADSLFKNYGPDSYISKTASILMGSSDTIIYTLSLYFGSVGIKKTRYALPASIIILVFCTLLAAKLASVML